MKNLLMIALFISSIILFGCQEGDNSRPSQAVIDKYVKTHPDAEVVDPPILKAFARPDSLRALGESYYDLESKEAKEIAQYPENIGYLSINSLSLDSDSSWTITEYNPMVERINKNSSIPFILPHERQYIFHKNGDLEIKLGNMVNDDGAFIIFHIDMKTGLITSFWKEESSNFFRLRPSGEIITGREYEENNATKIAYDFLLTDFHAIRDKIK